MSNEIILLKNLEKGERFYPASDKKKLNRYEVCSHGIFNARHGTATRKCWNETTKEFESKSGNLKVIKLNSHE